jgi:hypothetical protein
LFQRGFNAVQRQALPVGWSTALVAQLQLRAPGVAVGPGLHRAAEQGHRRLRPERGEVQAVHGGVGRFERLGLPGAKPRLGIERGRGVRRGAGATHRAQPGHGIERGVQHAQRAAHLGGGLQVDALTATGHLGLHVALRIDAQGHGRLRTQHGLQPVAAFGEAQAFQLDLVRVGHAEVPGAVGRCGSGTGLSGR